MIPYVFLKLDTSNLPTVLIQNFLPTLLLFVKFTDDPDSKHSISTSVVCSLLLNENVWKVECMTIFGVDQDIIEG